MHGGELEILHDEDVYLAKHYGDAGSSIEVHFVSVFRQQSSLVVLTESDQHHRTETSATMSTQCPLRSKRSAKQLPRSPLVGLANSGLENSSIHIPSFLASSTNTRDLRPSSSLENDDRKDVDETRTCILTLLTQRRLSQGLSNNNSTLAESYFVTCCN